MFLKDWMIPQYWTYSTSTAEWWELSQGRIGFLQPLSLIYITFLTCWSFEFNISDKAPVSYVSSSHLYKIKVGFYIHFLEKEYKASQEPHLITPTHRLRTSAELNRHYKDDSILSHWIISKCNCTFRTIQIHSHKCI